jgi:hypothetical protein
VILLTKFSVPEIPTNINKTLSPTDLERPEVAAAARPLKRLACRLWWKRVPFAVHGVLKMRWRIRRPKGFADVEC